MHGDFHSGLSHSAGGCDGSVLFIHAQTSEAASTHREDLLLSLLLKLGFQQMQHTIQQRNGLTPFKQTLRRAIIDRFDPAL